MKALRSYPHPEGDCGCADGLLCRGGVGYCRGPRRKESATKSVGVTNCEPEI